MIDKPTVKELLEHAENRYALVIAASRRAREIAKENENSTSKELISPVTTAANEIVEGKVYIVEENKKEEEI